MTRPIHVLVVEDSKEDAELCLHELRRAGFDPTFQRVENAEDFLGALRATVWDVILCDYTMPQFDAMEALRLLRDSARETPFIVVTGSIDEETAVDCLKRGVNDYILKENILRLGPAVQQALQMFDDRRKRQHLEDQLRQSQKMEAVGTLAAGVAHDFNNLLTAIVGYTEIARRLIPENDEAIQALSGVDEAARQATGVTRALLTFSRKAETEKSPVHLGELVDDSTRMLRRMLPAAIEIITDISSSYGLWVEGDAVQLQQVVVNLAVNARDAMPDGGQLRITVEHRPAGASDAWSAVLTRGKGAAVLVVEDTGSGMPEEVRVRMFEPFFTTKPREKGTGLGMAVVHGIVNEHKGLIEVDSKEGRGARITIALPCCDPPGPDATQSPKRAKKEGKGETIILAEDNRQVRAIIAATLGAAGYNVVQASDGVEAVKAFDTRKESVQLLILDVDLPRMGGISCLEKIRQVRPDIPAIAISGLADVRLADESVTGVTFLRKPFQPSELTALVSQKFAKPRIEEARSDAEHQDSSR